ncbi:MAG TPA: V-type ATPase 116kDa subunit family protein, partial [Synergistaceae bacterium]|nr:V-type ATPase 116kDa subunit family protein [Synergistaceae bacterium]
MIQKMVRFFIWGVASKKREVIDLLHTMGILHVDEEDRDYGETLSSLQRLKLLSATIQGMVEALGWQDWNAVSEERLSWGQQWISPFDGKVLEDVEESLEAFRERLQGLVQEKKSLQETLRMLRSSHHDVVHFSSFFEEEQKRGNRVSLWWVPPSILSRILQKVRTVLRKFTPVKERVTLRYHSIKTGHDDLLVSFSVPPLAQDFMEKLFEEEDVVAWRPPPAFTKFTHYESVVAIESGLHWVPKRLKEIEVEMERTREEWGPKLGAILMLIEDRIEALQVENKTLSQGEMFSLSGWVPREKAEALGENLQESFGSQVFVEWRDPLGGELSQVPTALKNPKVFEPFHLFLKLLSLPTYTGIDPTIMIGIFFPLFSGCMVGDAGYGVLIGGIGFLLYRSRKSEILREIGIICFHLCFWSILWGIAFGEFFGDVGLRLFHMHPFWLERSHVVLPVMVFSITLGLAHVGLGLFLGALEGVKHKNRHLWMERLGTLGIIFGLLLLGATLFEFLPALSPYAGWAVLIS